MENANWNSQDSHQLYHISQWGEGYFTVSDQGDLCVLPHRTEDGPRINIAEVLKEIKSEGIQYPVVLRFHDILRNQVLTLNTMFRDIIKEADYSAKYFGVYPVKVNQMREVVEEIVDAGAEFNYGLEAGSKAELMAVLAMNTNEDSLTVLNGYKDREYLKLALLGRQLDRKMIVVIEKFSELVDLIALSKEYAIEPMIGIRSKLNSKAAGKWSNSSGDNAKFGLSTIEILKAIELLKSENYLHTLKLFHFHVGSQIHDIRTFKDCLTEGARMYAKLIKLGAPIDYFDVGGGLGINYDGTKTNTSSSVNYKLKDYVEDVVYILKEISELENVPCPNIVTESGRAITAHHSCVITNVFGSIKKDTYNDFQFNIKNEHNLLTKMRRVESYMDENNAQEIYNDISLIKQESHSAFKLGILSLEEKACIESLYWKFCTKIVDLTKNQEELNPEIKEIKEELFEQYLCNFSVFQSIADTWGIGQVLPVIPISRLNEKPTVNCKLADITCDSDGKLDLFATDSQISSTLPLHELKEAEEYVVGIFLTGAYQDIMGDMHNLFGRLNEVHVFCDDDDPTDFYIEEIIKGNTAAQVLSTLQYRPETMYQQVKNKIDKKIKEGKIKPRIGVKLTDFYEDCLYGHTYLKN
jgi:arginine decarboxylase